MGYDEYVHYKGKVGNRDVFIRVRKKTGDVVAAVIDNFKHTNTGEIITTEELEQLWPVYEAAIVRDDKTSGEMTKEEIDKITGWMDVERSRAEQTRSWNFANTNYKLRANESFADVLNDYINDKIRVDELITSDKILRAKVEFLIQAVGELFKRFED